MTRAGVIGVIGVMASSACFTAGGAVTGGLVGVFVPRYETVSPPPGPSSATPRDAASAALFLDAEAAARAEDCERVRAIEAQLVTRDAPYARALMSRPVIQTCHRVRVGSHGARGMKVGALIGLPADLVWITLFVRFAYACSKPESDC